MIGIIGAMEEEVAALKSEMADAKVTEFASMTFYKGTLCGKDTVVVRSGIGKVNAAICAQIGLKNRSIRRIRLRQILSKMQI